MPANSNEGLGARDESEAHHGNTRHAPVQREDQRKRQLGDGDRVLSRAVGDVDPAFRRRRHVDRVEPCARAHDQLERAALKHRLGHLRRAHDQHVGTETADGVHQRLILQLGLEEHVASDRCEAVSSRLFKVVRDEHAHDTPLLSSESESSLRSDAGVGADSNGVEQGKLGLPCAISLHIPSALSAAPHSAPLPAGLPPA
jgi:hypothetical protein